MRTRGSIGGVAGALVLALLATAVASSLPDTGAHAEGHDQVLDLREAGAILPLETIVDRAREARPGRVIEVELEHHDSRYYYEVELLDHEGVVHELCFDAVTGERVRKESPPE